VGSGKEEGKWKPEAGSRKKAEEGKKEKVIGKSERILDN